MLKLRYERMNDRFEKWHIEGLPGLGASINRFTGPDTGLPHDHSFDCFSTIIAGGYIEEVFDHETGRMGQEAFFPGATNWITADKVHRISHLFEPECWTLYTAMSGKRREPSGYEFRADGTVVRHGGLKHE